MVWVLSYVQYIPCAPLWLTPRPGSERDDSLSLTTTQKIAFIVTGVVYTILALAALMGLIGAIGRKRGLVATYSTFMWFHLAAQVAVGAFFIYSLFQNSNELVNQCKDQVSTSGVGWALRLTIAPRSTKSTRPTRLPTRMSRSTQRMRANCLLSGAARALSSRLWLFSSSSFVSHQICFVTIWLTWY